MRPITAVAEMAREKTLQFNMRMAPSFKRMAEAAATADRRSLASLIEKLIADYCRDHGFREDEPKRGKHDK